MAEGDLVYTLPANGESAGWREPDSGGSQPVYEVVVAISSAEILALADTPIEIIPAPGANLVAIPTFFTVAGGAGSTNYTVGTTYFGPEDQLITSAVVKRVLSSSGPETFVFASFLTFSNGVNIADWANKAIQIKADSNPTDGDFGLTLTVQYGIFQVA